MSGFDVPMMLKVVEIEEKSSIADRFKLPYFDSLLWYTLAGMLDFLRNYQVLINIKH